jgi:hypothetical protein
MVVNGCAVLAINKLGYNPYNHIYIHTHYNHVQPELHPQSFAKLVYNFTTRLTTVYGRYIELV